MQAYLAGIIAGAISFLIGAFFIEMLAARQNRLANPLRARRLALTGILHGVLGVALAEAYAISAIGGKALVVAAILWLALAVGVQSAAMYQRLPRSATVGFLGYWLVILAIDAAIIGYLAPFE